MKCVCVCDEIKELFINDDDVPIIIHIEIIIISGLI